MSVHHQGGSSSTAADCDRPAADPLVSRLAADTIAGIEFAEGEDAVAIVVEEQPWYFPRQYIGTKASGWLIHAVVLAVALSGMGCGGTGTVEPNTIRSPSEGDTWILGEIRSIQWKADSGDAAVGTLAIQCAREACGKGGVISSNVNLASGSFNWTVGGLESGGQLTPDIYRISWRYVCGPRCYGFTGHSEAFQVK